MNFLSLLYPNGQYLHVIDYYFLCAYNFSPLINFPHCCQMYLLFAPLFKILECLKPPAFKNSITGYMKRSVMWSLPLLLFPQEISIPSMLPFLGSYFYNTYFDLLAKILFPLDLFMVNIHLVFKFQFLFWQVPLLASSLLPCTCIAPYGIYIFIIHCHVSFV